VPICKCVTTKIYIGGTGTDLIKGTDRRDEDNRIGSIEVRLHKTK
jgi:hypothetical protein